jgi:hypothetical protein
VKRAARTLARNPGWVACTGLLIIGLLGVILATAADTVDWSWRPAAPTSAHARQTIPPDPRPVVECLRATRPECFTRTAPR